MQSDHLGAEAEPHPWKAYIPPSARTLFIGTFPTAAKNRAFEFFYPNHTRNSFWKILAMAADVSTNLPVAGEEAIIARKNILDHLGAGVTDMGLSVFRAGESSRDEHLKVQKYTNVLGLLSKNATIDTILLTSSSGPENAARWFKDYIRKEGFIYDIPKGRKPQQSSLLLTDRRIRIAIVLSPSSRCVNRYSLAYMIEMYKSFLVL